MSIQEKFTAAVNVIRSLPKNGAYQPSKDLMLRFYAYYKQGTIGPNNQAKPSFWDVINRAKWQAWKNLDDMQKEKAMQLYVDELKKIVETMAYTNPVADFVSSLDSFYESVSIDDLEMAVGPIERGHPIEKADTSSVISINEYQSTADTDIDEECFHDVMESTGELKKVNIQNTDHELRLSEYKNELVPNHGISVSQQNGSSVIQFQDSNEYFTEFQLQIRNTVSLMKCDLDIITNRIAQVERKLNEAEKKKKCVHRASYRSLYQTILLIGWPIILQLIFIWFKKRNRRKTLSS